jgi:hypothetical protein
MDLPSMNPLSAQHLHAIVRRTHRRTPQLDGRGLWFNNGLDPLIHSEISQPYVGWVRLRPDLLVTGVASSWGLSDIAENAPSIAHPRLIEMSLQIAVGDGLEGQKEDGVSASVLDLQCCATTSLPTRARPAARSSDFVDKIPYKSIR